MTAFLAENETFKFILISKILGQSIDPLQKGVSLFLSYTNMNKRNSLHHVKVHPKISNFLQFENHSSKCVKVRVT